MLTDAAPSLRPPRLNWRHFAVNIVSPAVLTFALFLGLIFAVVIPAMKRNVMERKKEMIRELTLAACSELASLYDQERRGTLSRTAAQNAAVARIEALRYGDEGKDYFWITDLHPRMIVHPYRPELNGQDLRDYQDRAGKKLFVECARRVREQGQGYVDYFWQWKDDETRVVPKLSYVQGFTPWGWVVGTGIYLEDVRVEIRQIIHRVLQISIGISVAIALLLAYLAKQGLNLERQRWKAEAALRESEEKYRLLVEGATEGILLLMEDRPVYANKTLLDLLGYTALELAALPLDRLLESGPGTPTASAEQPARLITKNGETLNVLLSASPVTWGERAGQALSIRDISARQQTEQTLSRLLAELQSMLPLATSPINASSLALTTCELDTPIRKAAEAMARQKSSAVLIKAPGGEPIGIVTDQDLRDRVLAAGRDAAQPVATIMSAPLVRIPEHAQLFEAALVMQERAIQHLVVTDEQGRTRGVLTGAQILHAQRHALGLLLNEIRAATSPEALKDTRAKLPVFVKALLASGARVENITRIMSTVSDAILTRLIGFAEAELGPAPTPYSFVVLGSEARGEQTLATDQDNAIIYADVAPERSEEARAYFLRLGEKVCAWLELVGYRRCVGEVMACNPKWCQPLSQWREYFTTWITQTTPQVLSEVNVFFDFRCAYGDPGPVTQLRQDLQPLLADPAHGAFFFNLAESILQFKPPRGFFGNIQLESSGDQPATFNIKSAIIPLVNFARMYALQQGFAETNTLERLRRLRDQGKLLPSSHDELAQAWGVLMHLRLTHQAAQWASGAEPDNAIDLRRLTQLDRSMLKKVFADITVFQARLRTDFARTA